MKSRRRDRTLRAHVVLSSIAISAASVTGCFDRAPDGLRRTPDGPGAVVRYDLANEPLPDIPLPIDTATWPDPTSRTGLRINASLVAPTDIEADARNRFSQMEGWGTFSPITVSFDLDGEDLDSVSPRPAAIDLRNVQERHQGDDYDFADDVIYVINLDTGVPMVLDLGAGNFDTTLKRLDKYWANDTRASERNLMFETIDESNRGAITPESFTAADDTDFDGVLDIPNLDAPFACPDPDPICDNAREPQEVYNSTECVEMRRARDVCITDHLLTWYERESDTLILRPLLPLDEMTRYAVVITDRLLDHNGNAVKSPFDFVYHAAQESIARRVQEVVNDKDLAAYYGDIAGTGLSHVAFTWGFTTQPTVDDLKKLRDGLYGRGPFARWAGEYPPDLKLLRAVGLAADPEDWLESDLGEDAHCPERADTMFMVRRDDIEERLEQFFLEGFDQQNGPDIQLLLRGLEHIDYLLMGTFEAPFLLEGGPHSTDPTAAFNINYRSGEAEVTTDTVPFLVFVPKETEQFKQPFDVNIYGHGYTGSIIEQILYAGNLAQHGLTTISINAMGHGLQFDSKAEEIAARAILGSECYAPFFDALITTRARDLNRDERPDSGGDFWSSYLFHTRDGVRQSILDHIQLVRVLRSFGTDEGKMICDVDNEGRPILPSKCDVDGDGEPDVYGDFDGDGTVDFGGQDVLYGTWGESLGGILSGIHGAIDAYVTAASPGSGGGGLTDIGLRSFQGGVIEAVLLRLWGPLLVAVPATDRKVCETSSQEDDFCTQCAEDEMSIRWVIPSVNDTGELEITCLAKSVYEDTTLLVHNRDNDELRCVRIADDGRFRVGIPASVGDQVSLDFFDGLDVVEDYDSCRPTVPVGTVPRLTIDRYGPGRFGEGATNLAGNDTCRAASCNTFEGVFFGEGSPLVAPAEGYGQIRQTPSFRRFIGLAQAALEPGDPISFAPFYSIKKMQDPQGRDIAPHAVFTINTIGDMNVPLNSGIAFARATGALPFFRPDQVPLYPHYVDYATPPDLFAALGDKTPNQDLIDNHVIEGITELARHRAGPDCTTSANALPGDATYVDSHGDVLACYPVGCTEETEKEKATRVCPSDTQCDFDSGSCFPRPLGQEKCDEALFDSDDLDEGRSLFFEDNSPIPHRLARHTQRATSATLNEIWAPRLKGAPFSPDGGWAPSDKPLTALLNAYVVPEGTHTFGNGNPCFSFNVETYLTNLTARFFMTDGKDIYYLSHPTSHQCLEDATTCDYLSSSDATEDP